MRRALLLVRYELTELDRGGGARALSACIAAMICVSVCHSGPVASAPGARKLIPAGGQTIKCTPKWAFPACPPLLRLRGAGGGTGCKAGDKSGSAASDSSVDQLTCKMEEVWRHADSLRRLRWSSDSNAGSKCSASAEPALDGAYVRPGCPSIAGPMQKFEILLHHLRDPSALLRHEVCYAMGQTGLRQACPVLIGVLRNARFAHCTLDQIALSCRTLFLTRIAACLQ